MKINVCHHAKIKVILHGITCSWVVLNITLFVFFILIISRVFKTPQELEVLRYVNRVSSEAHKEVKWMKKCNETGNLNNTPISQNNLTHLKKSEYLKKNPVSLWSSSVHLWIYWSFHQSMYNLWILIIILSLIIIVDCQI